MLLRREEIESHEIWAGADVFMVGRFVDHEGRTTNMPAVRFGNISVMPVGGILQPTGSDLESYILDVHSRTSYSGSPVFVYCTIGEDLRRGSALQLSPMAQFVRMLGIHWGQFNETWVVTPIGKVRAASSSAKNQRQRRFIGRAEIHGLSGMTCAVPSWALLELLDDPKVRSLIDVGEDALRSRPLNPRGETA
jgi:hypothetical protein